MKTSARCITQFSKTTIDPNAVELAAGVFRTYLINLRERRGVSRGRAGLLFSMAWAHSPQSGFHAAYSARRSGAGHRGTPMKLAQFFRFREASMARFPGDFPPAETGGAEAGPASPARNHVAWQRNTRLLYS